MCVRCRLPCAACMQVVLAQRLGIANTFDPVRPSMHYRLRIWRADEAQMGHSELLDMYVVLPTLLAFCGQQHRVCVWLWPSLGKAED